MADQPDSATTIRLDPDLMEEAKRFAAKEERSLNSLVRIALRHYMARRGDVGR